MGEPMTNQDGDLIDKTIDGQVNAFTNKPTPVDADVLPIEDSAATFAKKKLSWANIKATLKAYTDTLYATLIHATRHQNSGADEISVAGLSGELADPQKQKALHFGFEELDSSATTWTKHGSIIFPGTTKMGTPTKIYGNAYKESNPTSYNLRIQDITNGQTIASVTGLTNTTEAIQDLGALSNLPTGQARWELQVQRVGGVIPPLDVHTSGGVIEW